MKTITIHIENDNDLVAVNKILMDTNFEAKVDSLIEEDNVYDELQMIKERMEEYKDDPCKTKEWEETKAAILKKYGF